MRIKPTCRTGKASNLFVLSAVLDFAVAFSAASLLSSTSASQRHHVTTLPVNTSSIVLQHNGKFVSKASSANEDLALDSLHINRTSGQVLETSSSTFTTSRHNETTHLTIESQNESRIAQHRSASHHPTELAGNHTDPTITHDSYPAFVLPTDFASNGTPGCNAWGPLCQTGSTVVGVKEHGSISTTTVPCSSFLSAQAYTVRNDRSVLSSWRSHFGRSPQCTAYAESERNGGTADEPEWLSSCGQAVSTMANIDIYPPGMSEAGGLNGTVKCCGLCAIFVPRVRLRYFPQDPDVPCGAHIDDDSTSSTITVAPNPTEVRTSLYVSDGFTYTSPSLYFEIMGTASFEDDCGQLGTKVVSSTLAIPPGVMSTVYFDVPVGAELPRGTRASKLRQKAPLKTRDLACPTWGVDVPVTTGGGQDVKIGYPFYPLLVPPPELLAIDPAWSKCFKNHWPLRFGIFDPPRALTANTVMVGSPAIVPTPQLDTGFENPSTPSLAAPQLVPAPAAIPKSATPKETSNVASVIPPTTSALGQIGQTPDAEHSDEPVESDIGNVEKGGIYLADSSQSTPESPYAPPEVSSLNQPDGHDLANVPNINLDKGGNPYGAGSQAVHAMTLGTVTYTEGIDCSCYSLAPSETLYPGGLMTMMDGTFVSLALDGASAVINGATRQLSPVITGVAPAFAEVLGVGQISRPTSIRRGDAALGSKTRSLPATLVPSLKAAVTISDGNLILTAVPDANNGGCFILGSNGTDSTTLTPGGTALTLRNGEVLSLGANGVLKFDGKATASLTESVTPTNDGKIGAAIATAFHMGDAEESPEDIVKSSETATATADLNMSRPVRGAQTKLSFPVYWTCFNILACLGFLLL